MAAALIVIEIAAPKLADDSLSVLVSACSRAARDAECVLARNANEEQPAAVAIVTLQSEDKIRVEVGVRQGDHDSWRTKDFAFLPADERLDRWRAVGFAIGTLAESTAPEQDSSVRVATSPASGSASPAAGATSPASGSASPAAGATSPASGSASPAAGATSPASGSASPAAASATASASQTADDHPDERQRPVRASPPGTQLFIGAGAIFGPGLSGDSSFRLGGALYLDLAPAPIPVFFTVGGSAATGLGGSSEVTPRWVDISLGAGVPLLGRLDASGLELRGQVFAEYFDASASAHGDSQTMSRWTAGVQGMFGGRLQIVPGLLLVADVQAAGLAGETEVSVGGVPVGSSGSFRFLGSLGLRVRLR